MSRAGLQHEVVLFDKLKVEVHASREAAAEAAANAAAEALWKIAGARRTFDVIFATGDSQLATLRALSRFDELPWRQVQGFHMDDYVGLPDDHPASFHAYLPVCPSTILRTHPDATVYLDEESAAEITELMGNINH